MGTAVMAKTSSSAGWAIDVDLIQKKIEDTVLQ